MCAGIRPSKQRWARSPLHNTGLQTSVTLGVLAMITVR